MMSLHALHGPQRSGLKFRLPASYKATKFQYINRTEHMDSSEKDRLAPLTLRGYGRDL